VSAFDEVVAAPAVVVGSGVAGLAVALTLPEALVVTKTATPAGGSTAHAQGGIAAAVGAGDSPALHAADTVAVAGGIAEERVVDLLATGGPAAVDRLVAAGARFDRDPDGGLALGREAGHSRHRIVHARGDATGAEVARALAAAAADHPGLEILTGAHAVDLVRDPAGIAGVIVHRADGARVCVLSPAVVLATGGLGRIYARTTNPAEVTGDGMAIAARAGARMADLEFVQFHPTALSAAADPLPLLTEAMRGAGARLVDGAGRRFMIAVHPDAELAPRDVVARAIWEVLAAGGEACLDATAIPGVASRFPTVAALAAAAGFDLAGKPLPVTPAAHYSMGGIATGSTGRASLPGLWAVGETASTGVHGANRLASNSLLEGLVFGRRVAADLAAGARPRPRLRDAVVPATPRVPGHGADPVADDLRREMWDRVGVWRDGPGLAAALATIDRLERDGPATVEGRNMLIVARLVAASALARRESRGAHHRLDHPRPDPAAAARSFFDPVPVPAAAVAVPAGRTAA